MPKDIDALSEEVLVGLHPRECARGDAIGEVRLRALEPVGPCQLVERLLFDVLVRMSVVDPTERSVEVVLHDPQECPRDRPERERSELEPGTAQLGRRGLLVVGPVPQGEPATVGDGPGVELDGIPSHPGQHDQREADQREAGRRQRPTQCGPVPNDEEHRQHEHEDCADVQERGLRQRAQAEDDAEERSIAPTASRHPLLRYEPGPDDGCRSVELGQREVTHHLEEHRMHQHDGRRSSEKTGADGCKPPSLQGHAGEEQRSPQMVLLPKCTDLWAVLLEHARRRSIDARIDPHLQRIGRDRKRFAVHRQFVTGLDHATSRREPGGEGEVAQRVLARGGVGKDPSLEADEKQPDEERHEERRPTNGE